MRLQQQSKDLERCLENVRKMEDALIEEKQKHEKETQHLKKQLSETHEQEVLLLKEELHLKNEEMTAVQNSEKNLKEQLAKLKQEKQNLLIECEQCKAEWDESREEEGKSLMRQLSEKHKQDNFLLKDKLRSKELALDSAQNNEEHLKVQVTQLIQENHALCIESDRLKEELQRQEEEGKSLMRQLSEKHKQDNFLLKEKLRSKELALDSAQNNEEHLKVQVTQLIQENHALCTESHRLKEELHAATSPLRRRLLSLQHQHILPKYKGYGVVLRPYEPQVVNLFLQSREEEGKSLMRQLSEKHKQENFALKQKLRSKELALGTSQNNEEHLKLQLNQFTQENRSLACTFDCCRWSLMEKCNKQMERLQNLLSD
ncbi:PREDICTED: centrosomal protein of 162 kDa-like [Acropora digitifera]|uniref:centrosomal protein of 162 kDa-like n=1 Tax=Acropora digitifera TaxID=70779 RepID=UPI00077A02F1|nr:PREDICTED: centrosomal protein of 162 kDa-like [Acropora digitifera]